MTDIEKLTKLSKLVDETDNDVLALCLDIAKQKILEKLYPIGDKDRDEFELPSFYDMRQIIIAQYVCEKKGTFGLLSHTEQGVTDTYASADIPEDLLEGILPYCSIPTRIGGKKDANG